MKNKNSVRTITLFILIIFTLLALYAYEKGIYKTYQVDLSQEQQITTNTDLSQGGQSTIEVSYDENGHIVSHCHISYEFQWPYCELKINLSPRADQGSFDYAQGVDLSDYSEVYLNISYQGHPEDKVRFYIRNYNPVYTNLSVDSNSLKINEIEFSPNLLPKDKIVYIKDFNVASWWSQQRDIPLELSGVEISNAALLTIASGGYVNEGDISFTVKEIYFRQNLVTKEHILFAIIAMWFISAVITLLIELLSFRKRLSSSKLQQKKLQEVMHALKIENIEMEKLAMRDPLTGLRNRAGISNYLIECETRAVERHTPFSLIFMDIDFFKEVNDQHGHGVGDDILISFGRTINENIRQQDKLARWGGEEFIILCINSEQQEAVNLAEKLCVLVAKETFINDINLTASFGVAQLQENESTESFLERADNALYKAKANGRNQVQAAK